MSELPKVPKERYVLERNGKTIFVNAHNGRFIVTDRLGCQAINLRDECEDADEIIDRLAKECQKSPFEISAKMVDFIQGLMQRGLLSEGTAKEDAKIGTPFYGNIEITRKCDSICKNCVLDAGVDREKELSTEEIKGIIDKFVDVGIKFVALTGGDPLTHPDILEIVEHIRKKGMQPGISTGLQSLTAEMAKSFAKNDAAFQVSVDGSKPETSDWNRGKGSFDKAMEGVKLLNKHKIPFRFAYCIMKNNVHDVGEMVDMAKSVGALEVAFRRVKLLGRAGKNPDMFRPEKDDLLKAYSTLYKKYHEQQTEIYENLKKLASKHGIPQEEFFTLLSQNPAMLEEKYGISSKEITDITNRNFIKINDKYNEVISKGKNIPGLPHCGAGRTMIHVDYKGRILPCSTFSSEDFIVGSALEDDMKELWETSEILDKFRNIRAKDIPVCQDCEVNWLCGGGCRAEAHIYGGDWNGKTTECDEIIAYYRNTYSNAIDQFPVFPFDKSCE